MAGSCTLREEQGERSLCPTAGIEIPQGAVKTAGQGFFLGGSVVKTLLSNAGDTGLTPWPRRSPRAVEQLSACAAAIAPAHWRPGRAAPESTGPQLPKPEYRRACAPHPEKPLLATTREKSLRAVTKTQHSPRNALKKKERLTDKEK